MIQLANMLHHKGFNITIIHTKYSCPNLFNYPHFTLHLIPDGISESEVSTTEVVTMLKLLEDRCIGPFRDILAQLSSDDSIACIIIDAIWYFTQEVADNLKISRIVLRTSSVGSFLAYAAMPLLQDRGYLSIKEGVNKFLVKMVEGTKKASGINFNTFKELEEPELAKLGEKFIVPAFPIGPFHKYFSASSSSLWTQDRTSISWLDTQATNKQPFLWVVRPGLVHGMEWLEILSKEFLEAISERGYIVKWAPQQEVLSHPAIGGFWTHSRWNSTLESICEGVPMICSHFHGDQMVNSRYVNDTWKVGIKLEKGLERVEIETAIRKLMVGKEGEDMRRNIMSLKENLDHSLKPGGSSYQSLDKHISSFRTPV
ncbi:UDP-Glycosyltransferase superfamily protein [Abeliophyllum distichum]|uniref:UDP-Glycosyltransferase superfamily protein n=1 Tax=Abeliophyllum distichum TaxID=126358 RepID=A0ABD1VW92_9LAMI